MASEEPLPFVSSPFVAVVAEEWVTVYRFLLHQTGGHHDAEELTQETFLRAMPHWPYVRPGTRARAWLLQIARNLHLDWYRRKQKVRFQELPEDRADAVSGPTVGIELAEQVEAIRTALKTLSELARSVFLLRVEGELSFSEIALALDTTEEAARWQMHQARTKLMRTLSATETG